MRLFCLCLSLFLLTSCAASEDITLFEPPFSHSVVFSDGEKEFEGTLSFDGDVLIFEPYEPSGYRVTLTKDGGKIEYGGLVFEENVLPSSRLLPLFDILSSKKGEIKNGVLKKDNITLNIKE